MLSESIEKDRFPAKSVLTPGVTGVFGIFGVKSCKLEQNLALITILTKNEDPKCCCVDTYS